MSYTIVMDEEARGRQIEAQINRAFRHCRIGKVTRKVKVQPLSPIPFSPVEPYRWPGTDWEPKPAPTPYFEYRHNTCAP